MKNCLFIWTSCLVLCLVGWSCSPQELDCYPAQNIVTLSVSCIPQNTSRAEMRPGVEANNENLIKTLDYFFYPKGGTAGNAVLSDRIILANNGAQNRETVRITIAEEKLAALFPQSQDQCEVFVVANLPEKPANTSLENLKKVSITTAFNESWLQSSFIMVGEGTATVIDRNQTVVASADIQLERLAAKLTIRIKVEESVTDANNKVWEPATGSLKLSLKNAASTTTLGGGQNAPTMFNFTERTNPPQEGDFYVFKPFYSYPRSWDIINSDALAFYVDLPWTCNDDGVEYEHCYYKVLPNTSQLDPNNWYHMDLTIGVIGATSEEQQPVPITDVTYKVVDWANGNSSWSDSGMEMGTELLEAHYLVVEKNVYEVNNQNTFEIPFITSHACEISWGVKRWDFGTTANPKAELKDVANASDDWITLDAITNTIKLNHKLINFNDNSSDKNYDYATYVFTITLKHIGDTRFSEVITIYQSPAMNIEPNENEGYKGDLDNWGYQFVNGGKDRNADYGGVPGPNQSKNPNMYVIETTVLSADSKYILGDPRSSEIYTFSTDVYDNLEEALPIGDLEGGEANGERKLSNYHATINDVSVQNMLAPKLRIASSYGVCGSGLSYEGALNRCATYQEDGYPAGRWRLPTMGEVEFMIKLSADGKIPALFSNGFAYWCANGRVTPQQGGGFSTTTNTTGDSYYVRCVYDEWYWEKSAYPRLSDTNKSTFTWGDE